MKIRQAWSAAPRGLPAAIPARSAAGLLPWAVPGWLWLWWFLRFMTHSLPPRPRVLLSSSYSRFGLRAVNGIDALFLVDYSLAGSWLWSAKANHPALPGLHCQASAPTPLPQSPTVFPHQASAPNSSPRGPFWDRLHTVLHLPQLLSSYLLLLCEMTLFIWSSLPDSLNSTRTLGEHGLCLSSLGWSLESGTVPNKHFDDLEWNE